MSEFDNDNPAETPVQDELTVLKERADFMGVRYHPNIGLETLRAKVDAALNSEAEPEPEVPVAAPVVAEAPAPVAAPAPVSVTAPAPASVAVAAVSVAAVAEPETPTQKRIRLKREASKLVRIRMTCMNPAKKEWAGEIFTVGNALIGTIKKFVPFNNEEGYHVPQIMLDMIQDRKCQIFVAGKSKNGIGMRTSKLIKEFAVEVLPPLTTEELHELAQRQAMAKSID